MQRPLSFLILLLSVGSVLPACDSGQPAPLPNADTSARPFFEQQEQDAVPAPQHDLILSTRREKQVPGNPEWLAHVDVNTDGQTEVLGAANSPAGLLLWRQPTGAPEVIPCGDFPLRPVGLGGSVAVASRATRTVTLFNLATPGQPKVLSEKVLDDVPMVMTAGVLDASRGEELFVAGRLGSLSRMNRAAEWTTQQFDGSLPRCATVMGPGLGLVIGYQGSDRLEVFDAGVGDELAWRTSYALPGTARDLLPMDLDGDGDLELVVVGADHGGWILGVGVADPFDGEAAMVSFATTAIPMRILPVPQISPTSWAVLAGKSVAIEFWHWTAGGPRRADFTYAGQTPSDFLLRDSDGDGRPDFWIANRDARRVSVMRMGPDGPINPRPLRVGAFPNDIATGDLDGDGLAEAFVINAKNNDISVMVRTSAPGLSTELRVPTGPSPRGVRCADINSDGANDLLWLERVFDGTRLNLRLGDGQLGLETPAGFKPVALGVGSRQFVVAKFPSDERVVVAAADQDGRKLIWTRVIPGDAGELAFAPPQELSLPGPPRSIATLHAAGSPRGIVVAMRVAPDRSQVQLYTPNVNPAGDLHWELQAEIVLAGAVLDIATGDLDGNGVDDVVYLASNREGDVQGHVRPLLVLGAKFKASARFHTDLLPQRVLARDFDGDGLVEIFVANLDSHNVNAWKTYAVGDGLRFERLDDVGAGAGCIALGSMDYEGDGDADLLVVDSANDGVSLILNGL